MWWAWGWLGCKLVPSGAPPLPTDPPSALVPTGDTAVEPALRRWVSVTNYPCALDDQGWVKCWDTPEWGPYGFQAHWPEEGPGPLASFVGGYSLYPVGLSTTGAAVLWHCPNASSGYCVEPAGEFRQYTMGGGITTAGELVLLSDGGLTAPEHGEWLVMAEYGLAAVDDWNRLYFDQYNSNEPVQLAPEREILEIVFRLPHGACVLDRAGGVDCHGSAAPDGVDPEYVFDHPPYIGISGGQAVICAQRADYVIECSEGSVYDFGPTLDFDANAHHFELYEPVGNEVVSRGVGPNVCVLKANNGIECRGARYPPELLERLPKGEE